MAEGEKLIMLSKDQKSLIHRCEEGRPVPLPQIDRMLPLVGNASRPKPRPTQRFGRLFEREFLKSLLPVGISGSLRSKVTNPGLRILSSKKSPGNTSKSGLGGPTNWRNTE